MVELVGVWLRGVWPPKQLVESGRLASGQAISWLSFVVSWGGVVVGFLGTAASSSSRLRCRVVGQRGRQLLGVTGGGARRHTPAPSSCRCCELFEVVRTCV
jgi:hypothetical protein